MTTTTSHQPDVGMLLELRGIPLFKALRAESLVRIAAIASHMSFDEGVTVFEQGDEGDRLYVVSDGAVEIVRDDRLLARLAPGQCFGEMAVIEKRRRSATAHCTQPTRLLTIGREDFYDVLAVYPTIARAVTEVLAVRLREAFSRA